MIRAFKKRRKINNKYYIVGSLCQALEKIEFSNTVSRSEMECKSIFTAVDFVGC